MIPPLNPPSKPLHISTNLPHCIVTLSWLPLLHLMHTLQGVYWKLCRAKSKWLPQRKGKWQRMSIGGATERGRVEREEGGYTKDRYYVRWAYLVARLSRLSSFLPLQCWHNAAHGPRSIVSNPLPPHPPTLFSPSSSLLSSACCTFWLCSGAQLK